MMTWHKLLAFCSSRTNCRNICRIVVFAVGLALVCLPQARAGAVVTSCDESHLLTALSGGGLVTFECSGTITLTATITISADTTIDGTGQNVTVDGGNTVEVFAVSTGVKVHLHKLAIANGKSSNGGGIYNAGTLIVTNSTFSGNIGNSSPFFGGGGINNAGTLSVTNSTFSGNSAWGGAAIINIVGGMLTVTNSAFSGNIATIGGGIYNAGTLAVARSTFSSNSALEGGAIDNIGTLTVAHSTFSGNNGGSFGGAILNGADSRGGFPSATLTVTNSTFSGNFGSFARGILNDATLTVTNSTFSDSLGFSMYNEGTLTLQNTIVGTCFNALTGAVIIDGGGNLSFGGYNCPGLNSDPLLQPLASNGGPTQTMALGAGSPAVGKAVEANCPIADQRGFPRPIPSQWAIIHGLPATCSIGAYEPGTLFAAFRANGAVNLATQSFTATGTFTLGADSDGASNPQTDLVQFRFGSFSTTIVPGSFAPNSAGGFVYSSPGFNMTIQPLGGNKYSFAASAQPVNLTGTVAPIIVQLTIGDDGGTTHAPAGADD